MSRAFFNQNAGDISKSIMSYCVTRTSGRHDAEDLAQDIIVELVKSVDSIRDDKAFYGFMWAVAGKVHAGWCRKKSKTAMAPLPQNLPDDTNHFAIDENSDLYLLRRELMLLSEKYRKAVVLYYVENMPCAQIATTLGISESMVKHLLFKARKILKEGMNMERNYGEQSYNPRQLSIAFFGGTNRFGPLSRRSIPQNILWACYNDSLPLEEISLQIGVAAPYLEAELAPLLEAGVLLKKGNRYSTNIIIFTNEYTQELTGKTAEIQEASADVLYNFIIQNDVRLRGVGFHMNEMSHNGLCWHIATVTLRCLTEKLTVPYADYPETAFGDKAFVWGVESPRDVFNCCTMNRGSGGMDAGSLYFMDYIPVQPYNHGHFFNHPQFANFFVKLSAGEVKEPNEYEKAFIAELIQLGYVTQHKDKITVAAPVYTEKQYAEMREILAPLVDEMVALAMVIEKSAEAVLKNHVPAHLKKQTSGIIKMRMFDDVIGATVEAMRRKDYLKASWGAGEMSTTTVVLE